jgi:hypothetical protein
MGLFGGGSRLGSTPVPMSPEERVNAAEAEQVKLEKVQGIEDAHYDAMTDAERKKYYLNPGPFTRFLKFFRGH